MTDYITLSCPSCGARLEVTQDIERFACAHCGREHIVKRGGGIVSLSPVVDALRKVEVGVDKTAAELAIVRLQKEIAYLQTNKNELLEDFPQPKISNASYFVIGLGFLSVLSSLYMFSHSDDYTRLVGFVFLFAGIVVGLQGLWPHLFHSKRAREWDETTGIQLKSLNEQMSKKKSELQHFQKIVSQ